MIEIKSVVQYPDFEIIERLVRQILHKFYDATIPKEHTSYFINKYQTAEAIAGQVKNGSCYYLLKYEGVDVGYLGLVKEDNLVLLDKLYLLEGYRGKKIGKKAIEFTTRFAKEKGALKIALIVHKENHDTIQFYEHMGFELLEIVPNHFETGQIIENYRMEKIVGTD